MRDKKWLPVCPSGSFYGALESRGKERTATSLWPCGFETRMERTYGSRWVPRAFKRSCLTMRHLVNSCAHLLFVDWPSRWYAPSADARHVGKLCPLPLPQSGPCSGVPFVFLPYSHRSGCCLAYPTRVSTPFRPRVFVMAPPWRAMRNTVGACQFETAMNLTNWARASTLNRSLDGGTPRGSDRLQIN